MANNDYITTDCKLTVSKNTAKLDEEIFLYKNDRNIKLLIEIVDNKYRYKSDDLSNLLVKYKASYAQVKWYKNAEVKKEFPIQATDDGKVVFVIEGQLIDEDTELGDYDLQLRLLNESQESIRSLPTIKGAVHILKPLFEEGDIATVNSAVADVSMLSLDGDAIDTYNSDGTYNQTNWGNGDVISSAKLNKLEKVAKDNVDKVNKMPAKSIVEGGKIYLAKEDGTKLDSGTELPAGGTGTSYDDTEIKTDINTIKTDLGTEELTTTAKTVKGAVNEVAAQYKDIASKIESGNIGNNVEPLDDDLPNVYITGTLPTTKGDGDLPITIHYISKTLNFKNYATLKVQGASSVGYPKKNFTLKLYKDEQHLSKDKKQFKQWGKMNKFVLKAHWMDCSHIRNVGTAKIWGKIAKSRADYNTLPEEFKNSPNAGATDGFTVRVFANGIYQGLYEWIVPKDKLFGQDGDNINHSIATTELNNQPSCAFATTTPTIANNWSEELQDTMSPAISTSLTNFIKFVAGSTDEDFVANAENYFDVQSVIDYTIFARIFCIVDNLCRNQIFFTYDGTKWYEGVWDLDAVLGLPPTTRGFYVYNTEFQNGYVAYADYKITNMLYQRVETLFMDRFKTRYNELRADILSVEGILHVYEKLTNVIKTYDGLLEEDYASTTGEGKFTAIPYQKDNNIQQIRTFLSKRLIYMDAIIKGMVKAVPCTAISLNKASLEFVSTDAQTLTATVTPSDTTDTIIWSISPTGICTVKNGVVTPIKDGNCTISATCGTKIATCSVTVTGVKEDKPCTNITLNNSALTFTDTTPQTLIATLTPSDTTDEVIWTVNPTGIVTVNNGVVTPKKNGECVVTATCGEKSATCNITISGIINTVQYIGGDGTAYIDTGYKPNNNTKIEIKVEVASTTQTVFGSGQYFSYSMGTLWNYPLNKQEDKSIQQAITINTPHIIIIDKGRCYLDSDLKHTFESSTFQSTYTLGLFCQIRDTIIDKSTVKIYYCKIWENDTLVRDFIPAFDSNNNACLYDKVENKYYNNANTSGGKFVVLTTSHPLDGDTDIVNSFNDVKLYNKYFNDRGVLIQEINMCHTSYFPYVKGTVVFDKGITFGRVSYFDNSLNFLGYDRGAGLNVNTSNNATQIAILDVENAAYISINFNQTSLTGIQFIAS